MQVTYGAPVMAPQTTGHPASLPADPGFATSDRQIAPMSDGGDTGGAQNRDQPKDQKTAPPSLIQIQIMEFLEQQAKELDPVEPL